MILVSMRRPASCSRKPLNWKGTYWGRITPTRCRLCMLWAHYVKKQKRYPEAEATFRQALAERQRGLGADHVPDTASSAYSLASVLALEGKRDDAISNLKFAVEHDLSAEERSGLATNDDLKALRGDPRYAAILATSGQKAALAAK